jgi:perosamine synthetase
VPLAEPNLRGREAEYLRECVDSGWVSSIGRFVGDFEAALASAVGVPHALSTCNGTTALHLALAALRIGPGDEVIVPDLTFAACANAVLYCGATPVLVDVRPTDLGLDAELVRRAITPRTRAILAVHLYGHPCDLEGLLAVAREHGLFLVEDVAEALGATYRGANLGTFGDVACFSFYGNKVITTGEGGACLTRDAALHERMAFLRDHGMRKQKRYWHDEMGFNYRLTNLQAAVGLAQIERLPELVAAKRANAAHYSRRLAGCGLDLPGEADGARSVFWMYNVLLSDELAGRRGDLAAALLARGVETRPVFYPLHAMPPYRGHTPGEARYEVSESVSRRGLSLPSATTLAPADIDYVCEVVREELARL